MSTDRTVRVSGGHTLAAKVVAVILDALILVLSLVLDRPSVGLLLFLVGVVVIVQAPIWQAKEIYAEEGGLRVRGLRSEALIPYADIQAVRKPWRTGVVHVLLRSAGPFGTRVVFLPPWGYARPAIELLQRRLAGG